MKKIEVLIKIQECLELVSSGKKLEALKLFRKSLKD